jgi:hypothetical protein
MKINLRIDFLSGEAKEITCSAADLVAFESKFDKSIATLEADLKITHLLFLAWHSEHRRKQTDKDFDNWIELVNSVGASEATDPK